MEAQSLIALADLVVSAGGTMNREAVALGTPVYMTYAARLGGVDEALGARGSAATAREPRAMDLSSSPDRSEKRVRRDPAVLARPCSKPSGRCPCGRVQAVMLGAHVGHGRPVRTSPRWWCRLRSRR